MPIVGTLVHPRFHPGFIPRIDSSAMLLRRLRLPALLPGRQAGLRALSAPARTPPERPSRLHIFGRICGYSALAGVAVGASGAALVAANVADTRILPRPLSELAVYLEGSFRYGVTASIIFPLLAEWVVLESVGRRIVGSQDALDAWRDRAHRRTATWLLKLVRAQGGIYVKVGQHVCALPVMPAVYVDTLKVLMDNAIERPLEEARRTFLEDFGVDIEKDFYTFDPKAVATASLAQVYRARLRTANGGEGPEVAIKVQHRSVSRLFDVDLSTIKKFYDMVAYMLPNFDMRYAAEEITNAFRAELDFRTEMRNSNETLENFKDRKDFAVPEMFPERCSDRILTMKFEKGVRIDDLEGIKKMNLDPAKIMTTLMEVFSEMMFKYGFVHCDPHPGNILVRRIDPVNGGPDYQVVLIDHGMYQRMDNNFIISYRDMWRSVLADDEPGMRLATSSFGLDPKFFKLISFMFTFAAQDGGIGLAGIPLSFDELDFDPSAIMAHQEAVSKALGLEGVPLEEQMNVMQNLPRPLFLLLKTNNLLRFVSQQLDFPINRFRVMSRVAIKNINEAEIRARPGWRSVVVGKISEVEYAILAWVRPILSVIKLFLFGWLW